MWYDFSGRAPELAFRQHEEFLTPDDCQALSSLPVHLQQQAFAEVLSYHHSRLDIDRFLSKLPEAVHCSAIEASIRPHQRLQASMSNRSLRFVRSLTSLAATHPALACLDLQGTNRGLASDTHFGGQLAAGIAAHSALTALRLDGCSFNLLSPAFSTLTSLRSLSLVRKRSPPYTAAYDMLRVLRVAVCHMPLLCHLTIDPDGWQPGENLKRPRDDVESPIPQTNLASVLCAASSLTSLKLYLRDLRYPAFEGNDKIHLPHLSALTTWTPFPETTQLLSCLRESPIAKISIDGILVDDHVDVAELDEALSRFELLKDLSLSSVWEGSCLGDFLLSCLSEDSACVQRLTALTLETDQNWMHGACSSFPDGLPLLQCLSLEIMHDAANIFHWGNTFCQREQRMRLRELMIGSDASDVFSGPTLAQLSCFTELTKLDMVLWGRADGKSEADMAALAGLKQLRHLRLRNDWDHKADRTALHRTMMRSFSALTGVVSAALQCCVIW